MECYYNIEDKNFDSRPAPALVLNRSFHLKYYDIVCDICSCFLGLQGCALACRSAPCLPAGPACPNNQAGDKFMAKLARVQVDEQPYLSAVISSVRELSGCVSVQDLACPHGSPKGGRVVEIVARGGW